MSCRSAGLSEPQTGHVMSHGPEPTRVNTDMCPFSVKPAALPVFRRMTRSIEVDRTLRTTAINSGEANIDWTRRRFLVIARSWRRYAFDTARRTAFHVG